VHVWIHVRKDNALFSFLSVFYNISILGVDNFFDSYVSGGVEVWQESRQNNGHRRDIFKELVQQIVHAVVDGVYWELWKVFERVICSNATPQSQLVKS